MDNDLAGADGDGTRLAVNVQVVFSQIDSVGAASISSQRENRDRCAQFTKPDHRRYLYEVMSLVFHVSNCCCFLSFIQFY